MRIYNAFSKVFARSSVAWHDEPYATRTTGRSARHHENHLALSAMGSSAGQELVQGQHILVLKMEIGQA